MTRHKITKRILSRWVSRLAVTAFAFSGISFADGPSAREQHLAPMLKGIYASNQNAAIISANAQDPLISIHEDKLLLPASTLKVLTAYLSIQKWGLTHRFKTDFYLKDDVLYIKGYGDPFLVSEELDAIKAHLLPLLGTRALAAVMLDTTAFPEVDLGRGDSDNPYDAGNASLAINFNSVNLTRSKAGVISSAEEQTPLTPLAISLGEQYLNPGETKRISLPGGQEMSAQYFGEIFKDQVLNQATLPMRLAKTPDDAVLIYQHQNSRTLDQVLIGMLKYSNNFIANQLYLMLGMETFAKGTEPADANALKAASKTYVMDQAKAAFNWQNFNVEDGAGLSRDNRISAAQMMVLLEHFKPWRSLLPSQSKNAKVQAKTGTLNGVRTYAGYTQTGDEWYPFVLMLNRPLEWRFRYRFASALTE
jgi:D-alanyl-D-alanine carboxypeptidase/D-alanyl-D-alanine-endopeptidase (penicillin-binding protein 4)